MAIFKETKRNRADAPDRSEPPDLENAQDHELGHSVQPPVRKKPRRDPPADAVSTAAASPIIPAKKRSQRPNNRPAGSGGAPKPSRCVGILSALLREGVTATTSLRDLVTSDEAALVVDRERGLPVRVFDRLGREHAMTFKFLDSNGDFRLIGSWGRFVKRNGLRAGDRVDIWAFRCCGGLGMALLSRKKGDEVREDHDDDKFDADELLAAEALLLLRDSSGGVPLELGSSSTSRRVAVRVYVRRSSIVRRPSEGAFPPFSTLCRLDLAFEVVIDGGSGFDRFDIRLCREHVTSEIRLHTRLSRAHECRSGVWFCTFALMSLIRLAIHGLLSVEVAWLKQTGRSHRLRLLHLRRLIEARALRARALPDELLR
uniref:TF-B3 domain-containing protein n=1 Tax=Ananas comosus var. bracteatus TaxID=296719 RepID=A0A6V7QJV3_ANACO|nr:unnamed protein product [Ananas comosus var. bracteatus]